MVDCYRVIGCLYWLTAFSWLGFTGRVSSFVSAERSAIVFTISDAVQYILS